MRRLFGFDLVQRNLVVAMHFHLDRRIDLANPLDEVVRKRVVIIDKKNHAAIVATSRELLYGWCPRIGNREKSSGSR